MKIRIIAKETVTFNQEVEITKEEYEMLKNTPHNMAEIFINRRNVHDGAGFDEDDCEIEIL